jgi:hypothetical protein
VKHFLLFPILLGVSCLELAAVPVRLLTLPVAESATAQEVTLRLTPGGPAEEVGVPLVLRVPVPGETVAELRTGVLWQVAAESQDVWTPPQWIAPGDGDAEELVTLRMFPAAALTGTLAVAAPASLPATVDLRLEPSSGESGLRLPVTPLQCPVQDGRFRCTVPAGRLDLRIKAGPTIPLYLWDVETLPGESRDLGRLALKTGSSIVGWVRSQDGQGMKDALVRVEPQVTGMPDDRARNAGLQAMALETRTNARGFFQIENPAPGMVTLTARQERFAAARRSGIEVRPDLEANLSEPLVLVPPLTFQLSLDPPLDPAGEPWRVRMSEPVHDPSIPVPGFQGRATPAGIWEQPGLSPGTYEVAVSDHERQWLIQSMELAPGRTSLSLRLEGLQLQGRITLGDEPLEATLRMFGRPGRESAQFRADRHGRFEGLIPVEGLWDVEVQAPAEGIGVKLEPVEVRRSPGQNVARVEIRLPDTELTGTVVDERGEPVEDARVVLAPQRKRPVTVEAGKEGRFTARGLPPGTVLVHSEHERTESESEWMQALLEEDEPASLRLVLQRRVRITGRVFSPHGPVPGAQIMAASDITEAGAGSLDQAVTGPAGEFEVRMPQSSQRINLTVIALGYPIRMLAVPLKLETVVEIPLETVGGTLVIDLGGRTLQEALGQRAGLLAHGGTFVPFGTVAGWARLLRAPQKDPYRLVVPNVEAGEYLLCFGAEGQMAYLRGGDTSGPQCSRGTLAPLQELTLSLPAKGLEPSAEQE